MTITCDPDRGCTALQLERQHREEQGRLQERQDETIKLLFVKIDRLQWWIMGLAATSAIQLMVALVLLGIKN